MVKSLTWLLAAVTVIASTLLAFLPASWVGGLVETQTGGRLTLGDAQGTLWRGSAFIGGAADSSGAVTPLLPGRFSWRLSPLLLLGSVEVELENSAALSQPVSITGNWQQWLVSPSAVSLPAERLAALGAPLNTIQPSGQMHLSWTALQLSAQDGNVGMTGSLELAIDSLVSRLSPVKPLGDYNLAIDWQGTRAAVRLETLKGPLLLSGSGMIDNGRLQFSGKAEADTGQEEKLANLLNLLGQRRREGGKDIIVLEFK